MLRSTERKILRQVDTTMMVLPKQDIGAPVSDQISTYPSLFDSIANCSS